MHGKFINQLLSNGYYGNTFAFSVVVTTTWKLVETMSGYGYALELVRKAKDGVTQEYMHLVGDLGVK